jgi:hypothetical protein
MPRLCALIVVLSISGTPNLSQTHKRVVVNAIKPQKIKTIIIIIISPKNNDKPLKTLSRVYGQNENKGERARALYQRRILAM